MFDTERAVPMSDDLNTFSWEKELECAAGTICTIQVASNVATRQALYHSKSGRAHRSATDKDIGRRRSSVSVVLFTVQ